MQFSWWKPMLVAAILALGGCGGDSSGNGDNGGGGGNKGGHTGTIRIVPKAGSERNYVFDKEMDGCKISQNDPMCDGGTWVLISAIGDDLATDGQVGVDLDWCGEASGEGAFGILQVSVEFGAEASYFAYLDENVDVKVQGTKVSFKAAYDHDDDEDAGTLHFEADCSKGGIDLPW